MRIKENKGITLIALVITIIVLLILAGVTIGMLLGENGLITKALKAAKEQKKAQYFEEINLEITTEKTERLANPKEELFILSIRDRITDKKWVKSVSMEGDLGEITADEQAENANLLVFLTKDGYEIFVDVDNVGLTASIRDSFEKAGKTYKVKYNKNGGSGEDPEEREVRAGFSIKLPENPYEGKSGYTFVGWADNQKGEGTLYAEGSYYKPEKDVTLYATWSKEIVDIQFDGNATGVSGSMETIQVKRGQEITLTTNAFVREGYRFLKWNTQADGQGTDYENGTTITTNDDITLYAIWAKQIVATLSINNGKKLTEGTTFTIGATAQSSDIETITVTVGDQTVYSEELPAETKTYNKAISIDNLNNVDKLLFNETYNAKIRVTSSSEDPKENTVTGVKNYTIGSAVSLNALASAVNRNNTFSGETIYQIANVTTTANYEPIGYYDGTTPANEEWTNIGPYFAGIYKGNGKTITLTSITTDSKFKSSGIFGLVVKGEVCNLTVGGENNSSNEYVGGIIGAAYSSRIISCVNSCKITSTENRMHGGIIGTAGSGCYISKCINLASIKGKHNVGGIVGYLGEELSQVVDCENKGPVEGINHNIGGIVGRSEAKGPIIIARCTNNSQVTGTYYVGGIAGHIINGTSVNSCINLGRVASNGYAAINYYEVSTSNVQNYGVLGGIVGYCDNSTIQSCYNNNQVYENSTNGDGVLCGGIVGFARNGSEINRCQNGSSGAIKSKEKTTNLGAVGGIAGLLAESDINESFNQGSLTDTNVVGGVVGFCYSMTLKNCYNAGTVFGSHDVGGVIGACFKYKGTKKNEAYNCYSKPSLQISGTNCGQFAGEIQNLEGDCNSSSTQAIGKQSNSTVTVNTGAMSSTGTLFNLLKTNYGAGLWSKNTNINGGYPYLTNNVPK